MLTNETGMWQILIGMFAGCILMSSLAVYLERKGLQWWAVLVIILAISATMMRLTL